MQIKGILFQAQVAFAASLGQFMMGFLIAWPSYTLSILASNETTPLTEPLTKVDESLLGSLPSLGAMAGTVVVGTLIDKLGRRYGGVVLSLPMLVSWITIGSTTSKTVVLVARFLGGLTGGSVMVYSPIYISEVAQDSIRGTLASGPMFMFSTGVLFSYIMGWTLSYHVIAWVNVAFSVTTIILILSSKESPVFLLRQNREQEARAVIAVYRGCSPTSLLVLDEISKLKHQLVLAPVELVYVTEDGKTKKDLSKVEEAEREKLNTKNIEHKEQKNMSTIKLLFLSPSSRRAFFVVLTISAMQVLMGMASVQVFAKSVFQQSDPTKADLYTVIFALVYTIGSFMPTLASDITGRRFLIISSSILTCVCMTVLGYLVQTGVAPPWVTVSTLMLFCFSFMYGAGSVPNIYLAELFTIEVKNLAAMIISEFVWFLNFAVIGAFPIMKSIIGIHGAFYFFAVMGITNALLTFFFVPETKGLSNKQIQDVLLGGKNI